MQQRAVLFIRKDVAYKGWEKCDNINPLSNSSINNLARALARRFPELEFRILYIRDINNHEEMISDENIDSRITITKMNLNEAAFANEMNQLFNCLGIEFSSHDFAHARMLDVMNFILNGWDSRGDIVAMLDAIQELSERSLHSLAVLLCNTFLSAEPSSGADLLYYCLGLEYVQLDNRTAAQSAFENALLVNPEYEEARQALKLLTELASS